MRRNPLVRALLAACIVSCSHAITAAPIECARAIGVISGSGAPGTVILLGEPFDASTTFLKTLHLVIEDAQGSTVARLTLPSDGGSGYEPSLTLCDLTGDTVPEIVIETATGGSGGIYSYLVYTMRDGILIELLNTARDTVTGFTGSFIEGFQAILSVYATADTSASRSFTLDLSRKKNDYIDAGVSTASGVTTRDVTLWGGGFSRLSPEDTDGDGHLELVGIQVVHGVNNPDTVAWIVPIIAWENGRWRAREIAVLPVGGAVLKAK